MIEIRDDVKTGDMVYFWFSIVNDKRNKNKPKEVEFNYVTTEDGCDCKSLSRLTIGLLKNPVIQVQLAVNRQIKRV